MCVCVESSCFPTPVGASLPLLVLSVFLLTVRVSGGQVAPVQQRGLRQSGKRPRLSAAAAARRGGHVCPAEAPFRELSFNYAFSILRSEVQTLLPDDV